MHTEEPIPDFTLRRRQSLNSMNENVEDAPAAHQQMNKNTFIKDCTDLADDDSFPTFPLCGSAPLR